MRVSHEPQSVVCLVFKQALLTYQSFPRGPGTLLPRRRWASGVRRSAFGVRSGPLTPNAKRRTPPPELSAASRTLIIPAMRRPVLIGPAGIELSVLRARFLMPNAECRRPNGPLAGGLYED